MQYSVFSERFGDLFYKHLQNILTSWHGYTDEPNLRKTLTLVLNHAHSGIFGRAHIAYIAYKDSGKRDNIEVFEYLIAIEMIHGYHTLRNELASPGYLTRLLKSSLKKDTKKAEQQTINRILIGLGDMLLSRVFSLLYRPVSPIISKNHKIITRSYQDLIEMTTLGGLIDGCLTNVLYPHGENAVTEKVLFKHALYQYGQPLFIGAMLGGSTQSIAKKLFKIGNHMGIAWQLWHDVRHYHQPKTASLRKSIHKGEHSFMTQYVFTHGTKVQQETLAGLWQKRVSKENEKKLRNIFESSGAVDFTARLAKRHLNEAVSLLDKAKLTKETTQHILTMAGNIALSTSDN